MERDVASSGLTNLPQLFSAYITAPIVLQRGYVKDTLKHYATGDDVLIKESVDLNKTVVYFESEEDDMVQFRKYDANGPIIFDQGFNLKKKCYSGGEKWVRYDKFDHTLMEQLKKEVEILKGNTKGKEFAKLLADSKSVGLNIFEYLESFKMVDYKVEATQRSFDKMVEGRILAKVLSSVLPTRQGSNVAGANFGTPNNPLTLSVDTNQSDFWVSKLSEISSFMAIENERFGNAGKLVICLPYQLLSKLAVRSNYFGRFKENVLINRSIEKDVSNLIASNSTETEGAYVIESNNVKFVGLKGLNLLSGDPYSDDAVFEAFVTHERAIKYYKKLHYEFFDKIEGNTHFRKDHSQLHFEGVFGIHIPNPELLAKIYVKIK